MTSSFFFCWAWDNCGSKVMTKNAQLVIAETIFFVLMIFTSFLVGITSLSRLPLGRVRDGAEIIDLR